MDSEDPIKIFADMKLNSDDFFQILETHRKSCQREGRHDEAELTRLRIIELRAHEEKAKKEYLKKKHKADQESLEEAHRIEIKQHQRSWEEDILAFSELRQRATAELKIRHDQFISEQRGKQQREDDKTISHLPVELLNMRKKIDSLAAAGEYLKSKRAQAQLDESETQWKSKQLEKLREKWVEQLERQKMKHEKEMKMLLDKWSKKHNVKIAQWKRELDILKKRYTNYKSDLENNHNIEKQKLLKEFRVKRKAMESISNESKKKELR